MENQPLSKKLLAFNVFLAVAVASLSFLIYGALRPEKKPEPQQETAFITHAFDTVSLEAKAAYVYDLKTDRVLYKKNETAQLPLASLTKLMTALVATELLPPSSHITLRQEFLDEEGDNGLLADESWRLKDLLDFSLVASSNDGSRAVASVIGAQILHTGDFDLGRKEFISKMNTRAKELGLNETYFLNESGLDESAAASGGYGSAEDIGTLLAYMLTHQTGLLEATRDASTRISSLSKTHLVKNTDTIVGSIPGILASKTGFTDLAGGNLAIAFDASIGHPIVIVVLGSSQEGRFLDVAELVRHSMEYAQSE